MGMRQAGFEPTTFGSGGRRSIQLSYWRLDLKNRRVAVRTAGSGRSRGRRRRRGVPRVGMELERSVVGSDRGPDRGLVVVGHAVLARHVLHDGPDGRVVHAADAGEEVVLDLVIQPP